MNCPKGFEVDHKVRNGLDNRKDNLRITQRDTNEQNRKSKNINNTSGYRNVSYDKSTNKYLVQLQIDGKNKCLGRFDDIEEAGKYAKEMREKYYGEYKGFD